MKAVWLIIMMLFGMNSESKPASPFFQKDQTRAAIKELAFSGCVGATVGALNGCISAKIEQFFHYLPHDFSVLEWLHSLIRRIIVLESARQYMQEKNIAYHNDFAHFSAFATDWIVYVFCKMSL